MSFVSQSTSPSTPAALIGNVHLSSAVLDGFHAEIQNPDSSRRKSPSEVIGLLFGTVDAESIKLERFEAIAIEADDLGTSSPTETERLQRILRERISAIKAGSVQSPGLLGWYVSGSEKQTGLLDRDVTIHNTFFPDHRDVTAVLRRDIKGHFAVEIYTAKLGRPLSKNSYRSGIWRSVNVSTRPAEVRVLLVDSGREDLFLDVYRTTKSLDEVESGGTWEGVRTHIGRLIPTLGNGTGGDQDNPSRPGSDLQAIETANEAEHAALNGSPIRHVALPPDERSVPPPWMPPSSPASAAPISKKKNIGVLGTAAWLLGTIVISVLTYIAAHLYLKPILVNLAHQVNTDSAAPSAKPEAVQSLFGLEVGQNGTALELRWNTLYPPLQRATSGKIVINDGTAVREVEMDRAQLASGRIAYIPVSDDVRFSLTLTDAASGGLTDSIRVLVTPAEQNSAGTRRYEVDRRPLRREANPATATASGGSSVITEQSVPESYPGTSTSPNAEKANQRAGFPGQLSEPLVVRSASSSPQVSKIPGVPASLSTTPSAAKGASTAPPEEARAGLTRQDLPLPHQPQISLKIAPALADSRASVSNQSIPTRQQASVAPVPQRPFTPPVALYRRAPILRPGVLFNNAVVPVIVHINESGKVTSVALAETNSNIRPEISKEALAAARKWRFSPAKVGDKTVSSEMRINFVFRPSQPADGGRP